ncbi:hypothetical protein [Halomontanus rarus]|uniref:hypothetical protein n=1 Tax=Halomontanus rarus TaxID=3034020 RepID=UPI001A99191D
MGESLDRFMRELCERRTYIVWICLLSVVFTVLQLPYLFIVEPGTSLFVVSTMNVTGFALFAITSGATIRYCDRRQRQRGW